MLTAQMTQPMFPEGTPAWAVGVYVILGAASGVIAGLVVLIPLVRSFLHDIRQRQDRQSDRMSTIESDQKYIALYTPPPMPPKPPEDEGGAPVFAGRPKVPPAPSQATTGTLQPTNVQWTQTRP